MVVLDIVGDKPLGAGSAKLLARLLTNLQAKTIVRSGPSASVQSQGQGRGQGGADPGAVRAQSLAQPFSKHAPHVATAYIRALIDPLSTMSQAIRQELEPGLFALCEIMGEYGRDAIMTAMLDDSGKAMMRLLWVQYDKQRYVGKG
ncbi:hypothetical protein DL93DRAFT_2125377 [Clavulina sp. PMI_390]|nr:hypothetical protein DL93DRAFT_2125377 [Clavulina sp. PMI_390]